MFEPTLTWQNAKKRAEVIHQIRSFFYQKGVVEVETPLLSQGTVTDRYMEAFSTQPNGTAPSPTYYLQTSPEFAMKRLLSAGYKDIYQLCKAFRDEEQGRYHNPEFTILEWYRVGIDHRELMKEVDALLMSVLACKSSEIITYRNIFINELAIDPLLASVEQLKHLLYEKGVEGDWIVNEVDKDILLQVLFSECIEKNIGQDKPCIVYEFPASQASLAKICQENPKVSERFEVYFKGIELANGFHELRDATEQLARFERDNIHRVNEGKEAKPIDKRFIQALESGLPSCSGVALGIDRLLMIALGLNHIEQSICFMFNNA
ncbi:elongation factor P--(R)-beta-lysine ligase [Thalassotalea sp. 1_MG-2023]|uniref:elongation factor P--(R)-beta-lysine ligase n=1 Tax=Thalassotalea sp. 1_MG-2023 TaxID=3062680 RepID=UPI0026E1D401|nr:elongation factor P--(R)-beta-lysine ligase [Thalassotalea sp. 1_MG-2023]MDO6426147.1 elongation factor P--(R)-beta-lysine ligase [Thalassotalea sp. 1_MG-2023]